MRILKTRSEFGQVRRGCVLTIGNFDGVHAGHRAILGAARRVARCRTAEMVVMTFEPHPVAVLHPDKVPALLTPLPAKLRLLGEYADNCIIVLEDNLELLSLSAEQFVDEFLVARIAPSVIVEGDDFHFGAGRTGNVQTLRELGARKGFDVVVVPPRSMELPTGETIRVSSTMIRYMLESGHVSDAAVALSRPYRLTGPIVSGWGRGRKLGFPTLNMAKPQQVIPAEGVYAGWVRIAESQNGLLEEAERIPAVFSIGQARTFGDEHPLLIEAHLLVPPHGDPAGKHMAMDFVRHLRQQHKFSGPEELARQIEKDCRQAKGVLEESAKGDQK
ncbi:MAG: bifunctional riboflavin kinase/FAD synthetase [Sedimentisphaerales bacterium]|nr:bifunctional riboflavin kinase/FAD synthetase [Sedimentisphaerales bacterium]